MKALISTTEIFNVKWISDWNNNTPVYSEILDCQRVAQVVSDEQTFEVYQTLIWVDCSDDCIADQWYYKDGQCYIKPQDEPKPE